MKLPLSRSAPWRIQTNPISKTTIAATFILSFMLSPFDSTASQSPKPARAARSATPRDYSATPRDQIRPINPPLGRMVIVNMALGGVDQRVTVERSDDDRD